MAKLTNPFDNATFYTVKDLENYISEKYIDKVPKSYKGDISHFLYDYRNKPRRCQICGVRTQWNKKLKKYDVLCSIPSDGSTIEKLISGFNKVISFFRNKGNTCESVMRKLYVNNIKKVRGTDNLMADPEYQKFLLENRSIAHVVKYNDREYTAIGSYEKLFLEVLSRSDKKYQIIMPGPNIKLENTYVITDAYIPEYNMVISIKDLGENPNYINNYRKSCICYHTAIKQGYRMIEFNGKKEILNAVNTIENYKKGKLTNKDVAPIFMKELEPELYNDI